MSKFEYRVVPAPKRGKRGRGIKGPEERFAHALETAMNAMAADGWDYVRTDALPVEERTGLTSKVTTFQHMLVFRRAIPASTEKPVEPAPLALAGPVTDRPQPIQTSGAPLPIPLVLGQDEDLSDEDLTPPSFEPQFEADVLATTPHAFAQSPAPTFAANSVEDAAWDADSASFTVDILRERAKRLKNGQVAAE